jgi:hypothetical protein
MKGLLIGCTCIILVLLTWAILSSRVETYDHCAIGQPVITTPTPVYTHGMIIWAEWIRLPRRHRRYYNPLRRYRLTKKQRRRLRRRLRCILERHPHPTPDQGSPLSPERACGCPGRWS